MYGTTEMTGVNARAQRILVVDDDSALRAHACATLRAVGMEVYESGGGEQALALLAHDSVDAVLLDIRMPGMDGFETCRRIRELRRGEFLPVIVTTGLDDMEAVQAAYHAGATDFVVKPINWTILKHRLRYTVNARAMADELVASRDHRRGLLTTIPDAVLNLDTKGYLTEVRLPASGWAVGKDIFAVGTRFTEVLPNRSARIAQEAIERIRQGANQASFEFAIGCEQGERCFEVYLASGADGSVVALVRDFTERRDAQEAIRRLEHYDRVTGFPNGDMLHELVNDMVAAGSACSSVAVMRLELSGLDYARSLLGNRRADELVRMCAERLQQTTGLEAGMESLPNCLLGRIRDTGFLIVCDDLAEESALQQFAERVLACVTGSYIVGDYEISVEARLGIAVASGGQITDAGDLFDRAELAMGEGGSAPVFWSTKIRDRWRDRAHLTKELQAAVNNGDLHLEYQPKVHSDTRELLGVEALARWQHPTRGAVSPGVFIPLAEENGLVLALGEFVLEQACRQIQVWREAGRRVVPVAVNFSGHQFSKQGLLDSLKNVLASYAIERGGIEIELTETVAMHSCAGIERVLQDMHEIGIHTAIDDFGTGHSSLDNLRKFRFQTLKIDRSFTADLQTSAGSRSLIRGIIGMGHALGMAVVAEGVEYAEQLDFLRQQRCDLIQGFLTGRPMLPEAIAPQLQHCGAA